MLVGKTVPKVEKQELYICSKTGDATIPTCVTPPYISFIVELRMLLLLHASPPHPLSCSLCTALVSLLLHCHPYILQFFNENVFILL